MNSIYNGCYRFVDTSFAVASATVSCLAKLISSVARAAIGASVDCVQSIVFPVQYLAFAKKVADEQVTHIEFPWNIRSHEIGDYIKCLKGTKVNSVVIPAYVIDAVGAQGFENLKDTEIRTVRLDSRYGSVLAIGFAKHLKDTQVTTVDLSDNLIGSDGAREFVKHLKGTKVTTVTLAWNYIRADGLREFIKYLKDTQVTTVDLSHNFIGSDGARDFVKHLKGTKVATVTLEGNYIGPDGAREFAENLKDTQVTAVDLSCNFLGSAGARDFVKHLKGTQVTTVFLKDEAISDDDLVKLISELAGTQVRELHVTIKLADDCYNRILSLIPLTNLIKLNMIGSKLSEVLTAVCEENKRRLDSVEAVRKYVENNFYKGPAQFQNDEIESDIDALCSLPEEIRKRILDAAMGIHEFS